MTEMRWTSASPFAIRLWRGEVPLVSTVLVTLAVQIAAVAAARTVIVGHEAVIPYLEVACALPLFATWRALKRSEHRGAVVQSLWLISILSYVSTILFLQDPPTWLAQLGDMLPKADV